MTRVSAPPEVDAAGSSGDGAAGDPGSNRAGMRVRRTGARVARPVVAGWQRARAIPTRVWVVAVVTLVLLVAVGGYALTRPNPIPPISQQDIDATVKKGIEDQAKAEAAAPPDGTVAYQAIQPSLVLITTKRDRGRHVQTDDEGQVGRLGRRHVEIAGPPAADESGDQNAVPQARHREQLSHSLN